LCCSRFIIQKILQLRMLHVACYKIYLQI